MRTTVPQHPLFSGFIQPKKNFYLMPNTWTDVTRDIDNIAELKVVEYILRHTWGWEDYAPGMKRKLTIDELMQGRKRKDGTRYDRGTGLSESSVKRGLARALAHGFITVEIDTTDKARVKKYYELKMQDAVLEDEARTPQTSAPERPEPPRTDTSPPESGEDSQPTTRSGGSKRTPRGVKLNPRTEKDTLEKHLLSKTSKKASGEQDGRGAQLRAEGSRTLRADIPPRVIQQNTAPGDFSPHTRQPQRGGFTTLAEALKQGAKRPAAFLSPDVPRSAPEASERRQSREDTVLGNSAASTPHQPTQRLVASARVAMFVKELSVLYGDAAHTKSNISQASALHRQSGLDEAQFLDWLFVVRSEVEDRRRSGDVTYPIRYFFATLRERVTAKPR